MSFESGTTALMICPMNSPLPADFLEMFNKYSGGNLSDVKEEPILGWVSGRHLLENEINENTSICGGHLYINLRKAERKIPSALLNAICRREELAYMQANDTIIVPRKERKRIKEEAVERNLMKMPPVLSAIPVIVDQANNCLYLGNGSPKQFDLFLAEFMRAVAVEPVPFSIETLMSRLLNKSEHELPAISFSGKNVSDDEPVPGRDFLTWLWYHAEENGGTVNEKEYGEFTLAVEGPLTFAFSNAKAKDPELDGAGESVVKRGNVLVSAEAKAALQVGKKLTKAKVMLARSDAEKWTFTFNADTFTMSGLSLPEGEEMELNSRFEERVTNLNILRRVFEEYFRMFVKSLEGENLAATEKKLRAWVNERESM